MKGLESTLALGCAQKARSFGLNMVTHGWTTTSMSSASTLIVQGTSHITDELQEPQEQHNASPTASLHHQTAEIRLHSLRCISRIRTRQRRLQLRTVLQRCEHSPLLQLRSCPWVQKPARHLEDEDTPTTFASYQFDKRVFIRWRGPFAVAGCTCTVTPTLSNIRLCSIFRKILKAKPSMQRFDLVQIFVFVHFDCCECFKQHV